MSSSMFQFALCAVLLVLLCLGPCSGQVDGWTNPTYDSFKGRPYNVSYDERSFLLDGKRVLLFAGSTHYFRSPPSMWADIFSLYRRAGLNTLQMIIFWSYHEADRGHFDFQTESRNVLQFMRAAADAGLFIYLRLGPYICAEYSYGGMPFWLRTIAPEDDPIVVRSLDPRWLAEANRWLATITAKVEPFLSRNGGPIIVYQLENEFGNIEQSYGAEGAQFVQWNANKSRELNLGVPMAMCSQMDAPQDILSTYNNWYADDWIPTFRAAYPRQPPMWTELWQGWMQTWTDPTPTRPVEDIAFAALRWYIRGGAYTSFYPFYGGSTLGRQTGNTELITSYSFDAPVDEWGVPHPRKFPHIQRMIQVILRYANVIVNSPASIDVVLPNDCRLNTYNSSTGRGSVAFLTNANSGSGKDVNVSWAGRQWPVRAWSTQVIDVDSMAVVYDTSVVTNAVRGRRRANRVADGGGVGAPAGDVGWVTDTAGVWGVPTTAQRPLEQLRLTFDRTDFLWLVTALTLSDAQIARGTVTLTVSNVTSWLYAFIDDRLLGRVDHVGSAVKVPLSLASFAAGAHELRLLHANNGVSDYGAFLEQVRIGVLGTVEVDGVDLTAATWRHQVGLRGEHDRWYAADAPVEWNTDVAAGMSTALTWWRWNISSPTPHPPTGGALHPTWQLDVRGLAKGQMYVNGHSVGRFFNATSDSGSCTPCDPQSYYSGPDACRTNCGQISQPYLHVPASFLSPPGETNVIVAFAERPIAPESLRLMQRN